MINRLTILLTNIWLDNFAGSEVVVRDLAIGLQHRGHRPIVYSPKLGAIADQLISRGISVIDDLRMLGEAPDLIHAHHVIPCGEALIRFPNVPAIYVCHAFESWLEAPAHFPQVAVFVAVDEACRDRLVDREGIAPERVLMLHNAVDLGRIPARSRSLNPRPGRALAFAKASASPEIRAACERMGIEYQALGIPAGQVSAWPEKELVNVDLVFSTARGALEALCCGCAVIVCDSRGLGGLVTSANFASFRARNFGIRSLSEPLTVERCIAEIARYDNTDAALVAEQARRECNLECLLDAFEGLYDEVLNGNRRQAINANAHEMAVARFLHEYLPRHPGDKRWPWLAERAQLLGEIHEATAELADLKRSRLLRVGRLLRRLMGRPTIY